MLKKSYSKTGHSCRVTFKAPARGDQMAVLGTFNGWDDTAHPMKKRKDGTFSTTISLEAGQAYRFRYLVDGRLWTNDEAPDDLAANRFGAYDCVLAL